MGMRRTNAVFSTSSLSLGKPSIAFRSVGLKYTDSGTHRSRIHDCLTSFSIMSIAVRNPLTSNADIDFQAVHDSGLGCTSDYIVPKMDVSY